MNLNRQIFNFSAGPSCLPRDCVETIADKFLDWNGTGISVVEQSHRFALWQAEMLDVRNRLRSLLNIPDSFSILFMTVGGEGGGEGGGASLQFSAIPFNLLGDAPTVDYFVTGHWSNLAYEECKRLDFPGVEVRFVAPQPKGMSTRIPSKGEWTLSENAAYCYICSNETIEGVQFKEFPETSVPLVIDMSSDFLSRPIKNWSKIGCIFATAQKNFGIAGMSVVIVHVDLLTRTLKPFCPLTLDYRIQVKCGSMYNTPPVFPIYVANVVFKWLDEQGGIEEIQRINHEKAEKVYAAIDRSRFLENRVAEEVRSDMNIPFFRISSESGMDKATDSIFLKFCEKRGLVNLNGFASVGGFRASIYNAMPEDGVDELVKAIDQFPGFEKADEDGGWIN